MLVNQNKEWRQMAEFPAGFRFLPTDQELINQYLRKKAHPWELPESVANDVDNSGEWSDNLSYFAESVANDGLNSGEDSTGFIWNPSDYVVLKEHSEREKEGTQNLAASAAAIYSNKRKQSFAIFDDFLMLQPSKRLQCTVDGCLTPIDSLYESLQYFN